MAKRYTKVDSITVSSLSYMNVDEVVDEINRHVEQIQANYPEVERKDIELQIDVESGFCGDSYAEYYMAFTRNMTEQEITRQNKNRKAEKALLERQEREQFEKLKAKYGS